MSVIPMPRGEDDDGAFLFRVTHIVSGAIRNVRPRLVHVVKTDNWFGGRWLHFAGNANGKELRYADRLAVPPFAPSRISTETSFQRHGDNVRQIEPCKLHERPIALKNGEPRFLDDERPSGIFIWYSGSTARQDRGSLMVYEVERGAEQRGWYAELQQRDEVWSVSTTINTSSAELHRLETAYYNRLQPLFQHNVDKQRAADRQLWDQLTSLDDGSVAQAAVLIEEYRSRCPNDHRGLLLHGRNLAERRRFIEAEKVLRAVERKELSGSAWRRIWLFEWAEFQELAGNEAACEAACREHVELNAESTAPWIILGRVCFARANSRRRKPCTGTQRHSRAILTRPF